MPTQEKYRVVGSDGKVSTLQVYRCDQPGCGKVFVSCGALYTHQGWHKRNAGKMAAVAAAAKAGGSSGEGGAPARKRVRRSEADVLADTLAFAGSAGPNRSEEHTSELQSLE